MYTYNISQLREIIIVEIFAKIWTLHVKPADYFIYFSPSKVGRDDK